MASPGSSIRSAAQATSSACRSAARITFSAYRRVPVRWRLGGGSAGLTFIILAVFAVGVGVLTDRQVNRELNDDLTANVATLANQINPKLVHTAHGMQLDCTRSINLLDFAGPDRAQIRVMDSNGKVLCTQDDSQSQNDVGVTEKQLSKMPYFGLPPLTLDDKTPNGPYEVDGYRIEARPISWTAPVPRRAHTSTDTSTTSPPGTTTTPDTTTGVGSIAPLTGTQKTTKPKTKTVQGYVLYARKISTADQTIGKIRVWLSLGVLGGAVLALLAGLLVADRAMRPIAEMTDVAREIERTRDPTLSIPQPAAEDEVAELAHTLEGMLGALDDARNEAVSALARQREFVADASHELRTPLTSVLANLELLTYELDGEPADSAKSALMATQRMRRLVADLLLLARADVERKRPAATVDLAETVTNVAVELGPVAEDHELEITPEPAPLLGHQDDLHRMVLNLVGNAISHTPAGTHIHATSKMDGRHPMIVVEDDGPGITPELQTRVFERFVRGDGDRGSRGTGLGLSIVSAVAEAHDATVTLVSLPEIQGTRFEIRFPAQDIADGSGSGQAGPEPDTHAAQTSTTTGRTIGRLRRRS